MKRRQPCADEKRLKIKEPMQKTRAKRSLQVCRVFKVKIDESKLSASQKQLAMKDEDHAFQYVSGSLKAEQI